jgi:hypothetical protein
MKKLALTLSLLAVLTLTVVPSQTTAMNTYGGPCEMAEATNWAVPIYVQACVGYMAMMDDFCDSGGPDWFCDTLSP